MSRFSDRQGTATAAPARVAAVAARAGAGTGTGTGTGTYVGTTWEGRFTVSGHLA